MRRGLVLEQCELKQPLLVSRLRRECENAKRRLSQSEKTEVRFPASDGSFTDPADTETVTRDEFREWTEPVLARVEGPLRRALGDAGLKRGDVQQVVLVGGATRMPAVRQRIESLFRKAPHCELNPDAVVALGAAVQAGLIERSAGLDDLVVTDVAPFTLGVEVVRELAGSTRDGYFMPIISRNSTIPISRVERVSTVAPNQRSVKVRVFQGESRMVKDNLQIAEFEVPGIQPGPPGQEIDLRFTYDLNGVLEVQATVVKTQKQVSHVVTRYAKGLSKSDVKRAVREMEALKHHPREDAQNRHLLRWAERLYQELPLTERQRLDELITAFEDALERQDAELIAHYQQHLTIVLSAVDSESDLQDPTAGDSDEW
jgi:molecular chaperone HscC